MAVSTEIDIAFLEGCGYKQLSGDLDIFWIKALGNFKAVVFQVAGVWAAKIMLHEEWQWCGACNEDLALDFAETYGRCAPCQDLEMMLTAIENFPLWWVQERCREAGIGCVGLKFTERSEP